MLIVVMYYIYMKKLRDILTESILSAEGPQMAMDSEVFVKVFGVLEKLPKCFGMMYARYIWPEAAAFQVGMWMKKEFKSLKGKKFKKIAEVWDNPGFALLGSGYSLFAMWDGNRYLIARIEELYAHTLPNGGSEFWTIMIDKDAFVSDFDDIEGTYYPCNPNMNLIEKLLKKKL